MTTLHAEQYKSHVGLRPSRIEFDMASGFVPPNDPSPFDWISTTRRLPIRQLRKFCDDQDRLTVSGNAVALPSGFWRIVFQARVTKTGSAFDALRVAIFSETSSTNIVASGDIYFESSNPCVRAVHIDIVAAGDQTVSLRALQSIGSGTDFTIEPEFVGYMERVANPEQMYQE